MSSKVFAKDFGNVSKYKIYVKFTFNEYKRTY